MPPNFYRYPPLFRFEGVTNSSLPPKVRGLMLVVSFYLNELEVLRDRIDLDISTEFDKNREPSYIPYFVLLTDVHFYVVSWVNLDKSLSRLYNVTNDMKVEKIRIKRRTWFDKMRKARNSIEHIDERAIKYPEVRHTPNVIQILGKRTAVIYNERVDIGQAGQKRIDSISAEIQRWLNKYLASLPKKAPMTHSSKGVERG